MGRIHRCQERSHRYQARSHRYQANPTAIAASPVLDLLASMHNVNIRVFQRVLMNAPQKVLEQKALMELWEVRV